MNALLIVAHGSRKQESNEEVMALVGQIEEMAEGVFDWVRCAFVQFATPSFDSQIEDLVKRGATTVVVFPHFLGSGSHVSKDIPELVKKAAEEHPGLRLRTTPHLGKISGVTGLIFNQAKAFL
jgi:sirohydrochlorin cobaltochelatase